MEVIQENESVRLSSAKFATTGSDCEPLSKLKNAKKEKNKRKNCGRNSDETCRNLVLHADHVEDSLPKSCPHGRQSADCPNNGFCRAKVSNYTALKFRRELWNKLPGNKAQNLLNLFRSCTAPVDGEEGKLFFQYIEYLIFSDICYFLYIANIGEIAVNYCIYGIAICKTFFKACTGIRPQTFDKILRMHLTGRASNCNQRRLNLQALQTPEKPNSDPESLSKTPVSQLPGMLSPQECQALVTLDIIFDGK